MTFFDVAYEGTRHGHRTAAGFPRPPGRGRRDRGSVLDVGCGTGENAIFLATRGHEVLGVDAAPVAIDGEGEGSWDRDGVHRVDTLRVTKPGRTFDTAIDVGLFHWFHDEERPVFANNLHAVLEPGGRYFMLCWRECNEWGYGPRRVTQAEIRETFAEGWTVDSIEDASFETNMVDCSIHAWLARIQPGLRPTGATRV